MSIQQCLRHAGFSLVAVSTLLAGCEDDSGSTTDEQTQSEDGGGTDGSTTRAGRGGSGSSAGRGGSASGGRGGTGAAAAGGQGGRRSDAGSDSEGEGGRRSGSGGRTGTPQGGSGGNGGNGGSGGSDDADAGVEPLELNDGQIVEITTAVNTGEITLGTLALNRAQLPESREFAQAMVVMHEAVQQRQTALATSLGITPAPSPISTRLREDVAVIQGQIENASDVSVDLLYIQSQVNLHARTLNTIDEQLLPNVSAAQLREDLTVTRAEVATHLVQARAILASLEIGNEADAGTP